ncbi:MAG: type II toxin-antitoxin system PemK/MazF family toxin [Candidatus Caenarcaniphilales bacterium]|nr:type II toxin-antitoxin system PemK/MazF family toxin [Candidatus Caenarcaniphilales bacterium]
MLKCPCLILQSNLFNSKSRTYIVVPILPEHKPNWPFVVNVKPSKQNMIDQLRHLNLKQLRAVDISRFDKKLGQLEQSYFLQIKSVLLELFNLKD